MKKLYVKIKCSVCIGKGALYCPYCDSDGMHFIEAADKAINQWVEEMDEDQRKRMREQLFKEKSE